MNENEKDNSANDNRCNRKDHEKFPDRKTINRAYCSQRQSTRRTSESIARGCRRQERWITCVNENIESIHRSDPSSHNCIFRHCIVKFLLRREIRGGGRKFVLRPRRSPYKGRHRVREANHEMRCIDELPENRQRARKVRRHWEIKRTREGKSDRFRRRRSSGKSANRSIEFAEARRSRDARISWIHLDDGSGGSGGNSKMEIAASAMLDGLKNNRISKLALSRFLSQSLWVKLYERQHEIGRTAGVPTMTDEI